MCSTYMRITYNQTLIYQPNIYLAYKSTICKLKSIEVKTFSR